MNGVLPQFRRATSSRRCGLRPTEDGRAIVEFIFLGVLLLLPMTYLVVTAARIQAASFAASLAGRESGRAFVTATSDDDGLARARVAAALAFADFDFGPEGRIAVSCSSKPCLRPQGLVSTTATVTVRLPLVPDIMADHVPGSVTVTSTSESTVDRFVAR